MDTVQIPLRGLIGASDGLSLLIILSVGAAVRVLLLNLPMRYDEALTFVGYASHPLGYALSVYSAPNNHLFHTFLVYLTTLGGTKYSEWLVRLPAFLAGMLIIPATYILGYKLYRREVGLLAAAMTAASAPLIEYSTNARGYTLVALFFLLLWIVGTALIERPKPRTWLLFAVIGALGFYTIPIMLYGFAIVVIWLALSLFVRYRSFAPLGNLIVSVGLTVCITTLLYLPVFVVSGIQAVVANYFVVSVSWSQFLTALPQSLAITWATWNLYLPPVVSVLLIIGIVGSILFHQRIAKYPIPALLIVFIGCVPLLLIQRVAPYPRVWLFLFPLYAILAAAGWVFLVRLKPMPTAIVSVLIVLILSAQIPLSSSLNSPGEAGIEDNSVEVTLYLKTVLQSEHRSIEVLPSSETLIFYFHKYGLPLSLFPAQLNQVNADVLFIEFDSGQYTVERMMALLEQYGVDFSPYGAPQLVQTFVPTQIYELIRNR